MLFPVKPYIGIFSGKSPLHLVHKEYVYELYFKAILGYASDLPLVKDDLRNATEKAKKFFDNVDDCVYGGRFEYYRKDGSYNDAPYFLIRVGDNVGVVDENLKILIDVDFKEVIPPIRTSVPLFVVKDKENQWQVLEAKTQRIIVPAGKFIKIWGYDQNHALVSTAYEHELSTGTKRAIIDRYGKIVYRSDKYSNIFPFYGTCVDYIIVREKEEEYVKGTLINKHLSFRRKDFPQNVISPDNEVIEAPRKSFYTGSVGHYDKMDAYEGDYDALWNTD